MIRTVCTLLLLCSIIIPAKAQEDKDTWNVFYDKDDYLRGFKDSRGKVMIEPRFMGFTIAERFRNIIAVMEEKAGKYQNYYLLKNGKRIGADSVYAFDFNADCEREGYILFRDPVSDKVGFFDSTGRVAVPAEYSDAGPFSNGMAMVLRGAVRMCDKERPYTKEHPCEHWYWSGGRSLLIDRQNRILVDSFPYTNEIDWFTMQHSPQPAPDTVRINYKASGGGYYSFERLENVFRTWLRAEVAALTTERLAQLTHPRALIWIGEQGWVPRDSCDMKPFYTRIKELLQSLQQKDTDYFISIGSSPPFFSGTEQTAAAFEDDCGNWDYTLYPVAEVIVNRKDGNQDHLQFARLPEGYRLINISLK